MEKSTYDEGRRTAQTMKELLSGDAIQSRIDELAEEINADFAEVPLLYLVVVLRGGCFFGVDLAKRLDVPVRLDYIRVATYEGRTHSSGVISLVSDITSDVRDHPVLVVDDIVDTGFTMAWILRYLELKGPSTVKVAALLDKPARREVQVPIDYLGFVVPNVFVAGYGLDGLDDTMANVPRILAVEETKEEAFVPPQRIKLPAGVP